MSGARGHGGNPRTGKFGRVIGPAGKDGDPRA
jgi:hypothetical protein